MNTALCAANAPFRMHAEWRNHGECNASRLILNATQCYGSHMHKGNNAQQMNTNATESDEMQNNEAGRKEHAFGAERARHPFATDSDAS